MGKRKQEESKDAQTKKVKVDDEPKPTNTKEVSVALQLPELSQEKKTSIDVKDKSVTTGEWTELNLGERIVRCLVERMNLTRPTVIQKLAIPHLLQHKDVLMKSQTGSGKTLCYALAALQELSSLEPKITRADGTCAVIIVPTRELAVQTYEVLDQICRAVYWIVPGILMGGEKKASEKARIRKGISMLVSTPGRLLDHLRTTEAFTVNNLRWVILDEADRLLDMGFEKDVITIIDELKKRIVQKSKPLQSVLISATMDTRVQQLASQLLNDPVNIYLENPQSQTNNNNGEEGGEGTSDLHSTPRSLKQYYVVAPLKQKLSALSAFLRWKTGSIEDCKIIVFFSNCDSVDFHTLLINQTRIKSDNSDDTEPLVKVPVYRLHGNLPQQERMKVFQDFRKSKASVLMCTDVAARGMDIAGIDWTVQYDPPGEPKEYVHRVGRAARAGREGNSLLFLAPGEEGYLSLLQGCKLSLLPVESILSKVGDPTLLQLCYENMLLVDDKLMSLSKQAYFATLRAYSTHSKESKQIFHVKKLHLGHLAKSFALRDTPTQFKESEQKRIKENYKNEKMKSKDKMTRKKFRNVESVSEFDAGIDQ